MLEAALARVKELEDELREQETIADLNLARAEEAEARCRVLEGQLARLLTDVTYPAQVA